MSRRFHAILIVVLLCCTAVAGFAFSSSASAAMISNTVKPATPTCMPTGITGEFLGTAADTHNIAVSGGTSGFPCKTVITMTLTDGSWNTTLVHMSDNTGFVTISATATDTVDALPYGTSTVNYSLAPTTAGPPSTGSFTINLVKLNQPPVATNGSFTTPENTAKAVTLSAHDPDNGPSSLTYTIVAAPTHGALSGTAPNLTYTPSNGYSGPDSFTWKAYDGADYSTKATDTITVTPVTSSSAPPTSTAPSSGSTSPSKGGSSSSGNTGGSTTFTSMAASSSAVGAPVGETSDSNSSNDGWLYGVVALLAVVGMILFRRNQHQPSSRGRHAD